MSTSTRPEQRFASGASDKGGGRDSGGKATETSDKSGKAKKKKGGFITSKKGLIVLVALLGVGGGAYKAFMPAPKPGPPTGGAFVALDPLTVNLQDGHYLKLAVAVQLVSGKGSATSFQAYQADALTVSEFSDRTVAELSTQSGRNRLTADLLTKVQSAYPGEVYRIYLTQFVTQ